MDKGDLKTLEIQPEQNVYLVSGKTKMMKITLQRFYTITKRLTKITNEAKSQKGLDFKVKEEEKQSVFVSMLTTLIPVLIIAFYSFSSLAKHKAAAVASYDELW